MLKLFFPITLTLILTLNLQSQIIPDGGLELWPTCACEPLYWRTNNIYPPPLDCRQVFLDYLNKYSGALCAKGKVDSCVQLQMQKPPMLRSLEIQIQQRPPALHGFYRFYPIGGDKFYARAEIYKNQSLIGLGEFKSSAEVPQYVEFVANINYLTADTPDVAILRFTIDSSDFDKKIHNGSYWYLDELTFGPVSGLDSDGNNFPSTFYLSQNYPNPFNPSTKIRFEVPEADSPLLGGARGGFVTLKVYDILGNEVATLVNEHKPAGSYEVEFNAAETRHGVSLQSGVYFYQLQAGRFSQTKKLVLIR